MTVIGTPGAPDHGRRPRGQRLRARIGPARGRSVRVDASDLMPHLDDDALRAALTGGGLPPARRGDTEAWRSWLAEQASGSRSVQRLVSRPGPDLTLSVHVRDLARWACRERADVLAAVVVTGLHGSPAWALAEMGSGRGRAWALTRYLLRERLSGGMSAGWHYGLAEDLEPSLRRLLAAGCEVGLGGALRGRADSRDLARLAALAPWVVGADGASDISGSRASAYRDAGIGAREARALEVGTDRPSVEALQALAAFAAAGGR